MLNRQFDTRTETRSSLSRQPVRRREQGHVAETSIFPKRDPLPRAINSAGNLLSASTHAAMLKCATAGRPSRAGQSLLQLQRRYGNRYVQRVLALARKRTGEAEAVPDVEQAIQRVRGGGQTLDSGARIRMESAFGADFSGVRVHTDGGADTLNRQLSARAFTTGQDIFFRQGAYNPGSSSGRELLAHELTHVVQQNGDKVQRKLTVGQPGDKYEQEADQVARAVMQQEQQPVQKESDEGLVRRQIEEEEEEVQMKSEYSRVQREVEEEEEEEPVQTKAENAWIQRQIREEEEVIQPKAEDSSVQRQVEEEEEEETLQAKEVSGQIFNLQPSIRFLQYRGQPFSQSIHALSEPRVSSNPIEISRNLSSPYSRGILQQNEVPEWKKGEKRFKLMVEGLKPKDPKSNMDKLKLGMDKLFTTLGHKKTPSLLFPKLRLSPKGRLFWFLVTKTGTSIWLMNQGKLPNVIPDIPLGKNLFLDVNLEGTFKKPGLMLKLKLVF